MKNLALISVLAMGLSGCGYGDGIMNVLTAPSGWFGFGDDADAAAAVTMTDDLAGDAMTAPEDAANTLIIQ